jgi:DNA-binding response OmpR family regulator
MHTILIVEDDPAVARGLKETLRAEHYSVIVASSGLRGYNVAKTEPVDCILLDLKLPEKTGEDVCRDLRKDGVTIPILMLTSKKLEMDKVVGLEIGADDYVTKPFSSKELLARIRALLRRGGKLRARIEECTFGDVYVDFRKQEATKGKKPVKLSSREFEVLQYLIQHTGGVVTRERFLNDVWGYEQYPTTRTVDNYILSLRKKLEDSPAKPRHILTVYTSGYRFMK